MSRELSTEQFVVTNDATNRLKFREMKDLNAEQKRIFNDLMQKQPPFTQPPEPTDERVTLRCKDAELRLRRLYTRWRNFQKTGSCRTPPRVASYWDATGQKCPFSPSPRVDEAVEKKKPVATTPLPAMSTKPVADDEEEETLTDTSWQLQSGRPKLTVIGSTGAQGKNQNKNAKPVAPSMLHNDELDVPLWVLKIYAKMWKRVYNKKN